MLSKADALREVRDAFQNGAYASGFGNAVVSNPTHEDEPVRAAAANSPRVAEDDGPHEFGFRLVWDGVSYDLQPQVWRTLHYFWDRHGTLQGAFEDELWGASAEVEHATVRKALQRANEALKKAQVGWTLVLRHGQIRKDQVTDTCDQLVTAGSQ